MYDYKSGFKWTIVLSVLLSLFVVFTGCSTGTGNGAGNPVKQGNVQEIKPNDNLTISISDLSQTAKFYPIKVDQTAMEVFALRAPDGTIRTALNTCQICHGSPKAYFEQKGSVLECQNCGNQFPLNRIGVEAGGCNPVPILEDEKTVTNESIAISYDTLKTNTALFPSNWKQ